MNTSSKGENYNVLCKGEIFTKIINQIENNGNLTKIYIASGWISGSKFKEILSKLQNVKIELIIRNHEFQDLLISNNDIFTELQKPNVQIYLSPHIHAKFMIFEYQENKRTAILGSANFTNPGLFAGGQGNFEADYFIDDQNEIDNKLLKYFNFIKKQSTRIDDSIVGISLNLGKSDEFYFLCLNDEINEETFVKVEIPKPIGESYNINGDEQDDICGGKSNDIESSDSNNTKKENNHKASDSCRQIIAKVTELISVQHNFIFNPLEETVVYENQEVLTTLFRKGNVFEWRLAAALTYRDSLEFSPIKIAKAKVLFQQVNNEVVTNLEPITVGTLIKKIDIVTTLLNKNKDNNQLNVEIGHLIGKQNESKDKQNESKVTLNLDEIYNKHIAIIGTTGSGKSNFTKLLLENICNSSNDDFLVIVIDPHGEYAQICESNSCKNCSKVDFETEKFLITAEQVIEFFEELGLGEYFLGNKEGKKKRRNELYKKIFPDIDKLKEIKDTKSILTSLEENQNKSNDISLEEIKKIISARGFDETKVLNNEEVIGKINSIYSNNSNTPQKIIVLNLRNVTDALSRNNIVGLLLENIFKKVKKGEIKKKIIILLEEAHNFVPERGYGDITSGSGNYCVPVVQKIAAEGRKFGIGLMVVTQRPAQVSKYILSQTNTSVIFRIVNRSDLDAMSTTIESLDENLISKIPTLQVGQCIISSSALPFPLLVKVDKASCS